MSSNYTPPPGAPPSRVTPRSDSLSTDALPDEPPPPPYTPAAGPQGDTSVQAGPSHVDFSGPAPRRLEQNITGVGVGYGRRPDPPAQAWSSSSAQHTGRGGWGGLSPHDTGAVGSHGSMQPPPTHPSRLETSQPTKGGPSSAGSSRPPPPNDVTPTEAPTPGRPLLHHGMMLIYPQGYFCSKCTLSRLSLRSVELMGG